jgi:hypothetical protein
MRALGFYPTEFEIQELLNEMRYAKFQETGQTCKDIEFDELIRGTYCLLLNPASLLSRSDVQMQCM